MKKSLKLAITTGIIGLSATGGAALILNNTETGVEQSTDTPVIQQSEVQTVEPLAEVEPIEEVSTPVIEEVTGPTVAECTAFEAEVAANVEQLQADKVAEIGNIEETLKQQAIDAYENDEYDSLPNSTIRKRQLQVEIDTRYEDLKVEEEARVLAGC